MKHENHSVDWLYEEAAYHWSKWLPSEANNTVLHGGFYSVLVRPGFRIISMNMNYCHSLSWLVKEMCHILNDRSECCSRQ